VFKGALPALVPLVVTLALVTYIPVVSMGLPEWLS
jgi:TRAP-type C4-dicarboxylate transport system permease large subunit